MRELKSNKVNPTCGICRMRKQYVVNLGYDDGGGWGNKTVCVECLPMVTKKGEKRDGPRNPR